MFLLALALSTTHAQSPSPGPVLRLEPRTNAWDLVVGSISSTGALFLHRAPDLPALVDSPTLMLQTNTPLTNVLRLPVLPASGVSNQAFFSAIHWPGRSVEDFGDPEYAPDPVPPDMILVTSGAPDTLVPQQSFAVDFFVTDTNGQMLAVTAPATVLILRELDGQPHPDAVVAPPGGQVTNGHLRLTLTIQVSTPLDGYTLGLELTLGSLGRAKNLTTQQLQTLISLNNIQCQAGQSPKQCLDAWRLTNADASATWSYPLAGTGHPVSGTFGEWRGEIKPDNSPPELVGTVHKGLDLAAVAVTTVRASRGGVVSARGIASGAYLVVDHGTGWFSRYLHLDGSSIAVRVGQAVTTGQTLATRLHSGGTWAVHFHFEVRSDANQARWGVGMPGSGKDPLQSAGIFPVAAGTAPPRLEEFGLSRVHPGDTPFVKSAPDTDGNGPVYVFARFLDREQRRAPGSGCDPDYHRLGLRSMGFTPEGATESEEIRPENDSAIALLKPPVLGSPVPPTKRKGFARYSGPHTASAERCNYFRYWWRWDTSSYATDRSGPRAILLTGVDHNPSTSDFHFTFGPQVKTDTLTLVEPQQYQFTAVAHLGTNTPDALNNAALFVQPDQYRMQILQANGTPLDIRNWTEDGDPLVADPTTHTTHTRVFTEHLDEAVYTFTLPDGTNPDGLKLRVSSRLAPDIGHEVCLCGGPNMVVIPAGSFTMGNCMDPDEGYDELPLHSVYVSAFCMDKYEVTKALWDDVYSWAIAHGYSFEFGAAGKAPNHPAQNMTWYDAVKWCNARSEKEGRTPAYYTDAGLTQRYRSGQVAPYVNWNAGYRLPTEAEWEKAARGGASGHRFPWSNVDTITHSQANYLSWLDDSYDTSPTREFHPTFNDGVIPYTSPVGYFAANGYGLYDMAGNVWEWCWDWADRSYYGSSPGADPRGPSSGRARVHRGGGWDGMADCCRAASRYRESYGDPACVCDLGFRAVLPPGQP